MPCLHKFHEYLNLEGIDFEPTTLIVGTFNPAWPVAGNPAQWFYGRTQRNYFWDVLPRLYNPIQNLRQATSADWKAFCSQYQISLTDMIACIHDADEHNAAHQSVLGKYLDTDIANHFHDFTYTDIIGLLLRYPTIRYVYLTRQPGVPLFDVQWATVEAYGQENGLHVRNLITPSFNARFQMGDYRLNNPNDVTPLRNFIWSKWVEQWHI